MTRWALLCVSLLSIPAHAGTTGGLLVACEAPPGTPGAQTCSAYINGLGEGILADQIAREDGTAICLPEGISTIDIREAIKTYILKKDLKILDLPSGGVVAAAMQAAYPCRKSN